MRTWIFLIALCACTDDLADKTQEAARRANKASDHLRHERGELTREAGSFANAQVDFENLRFLRVQSLRAEHSVLASQPLVIVAIAPAKELLPTHRRRLDENLVIFRQRLSETRALIDQLQYVPASQWEQRDDEVAQAMAGLFIARDASWRALEDKPHDKFPAT